MVNATHLAMLEVVKQPDGRFTVQSIGEIDADDGQTFETEEEAEAYRLELAEELEARSDGLDVLKPGGGQGLR